MENITGEPGTENVTHRHENEFCIIHGEEKGWTENPNVDV